MKPIKEPDAIICSKTANVKNPVLGSKVLTCERCLSKVWAAPETISLMHRRPFLPIWCPSCALKEVEDRMREAIEDE